MFPKMDLTNLPKISIEQLPEIGDVLMENLPRNENVIGGRLFDEVVEEGDIDEVVVGSDVVVYTKYCSKRPWIGRVLEILPNNQFVIHWFIRQTKKKEFYDSF